VSTRAIITVKGEGDTRRLYAHGDGYPSGVGAMVNNFLKILPSLGQFGSRKVQTAAWGDYTRGKEGRYKKFSGLGRAYSLMSNVAAEPDQFVPALTTYMNSKGYGSLYLTDRDPEKEAKEEPYGTDIEWHYVVTLNPTKPRLDVFSHDHNKGFKRHSQSIDELIEAEQAEWRRYQEEQRQKAAPVAKKKARTVSRKRVSSQIKGMR
jgi:hypothetical protein